MENEKSRCIASEKLCETGFSYTLSLINGKYKMTILYTLMASSAITSCSGISRGFRIKR